MTSLLAQLQAANGPIAKSYDVSPKAHKANRRNIKIAHEGASRKAFIKYMIAMKHQGWMSTTRVEFALGYASTVARGFLLKLLDKGTIERRPRGGPKYSRYRGWEWRWIGENYALYTFTYRPRPVGQGNRPGKDRFTRVYVRTDSFRR